MGVVIEYRRDSRRLARLSQKKRDKDEQPFGQIIIFPGIRRERHEDYIEECVLEDGDVEVEEGRRGLFDFHNQT